MSTETLGELASLIRSKNAGPFWITFDIMFGSERDYWRAVDSGVINKPWVAATWGVDISQVLLVELAAARAIKFSFPRQRPQGDPGESDQYSGQQYAPLLDLPV